MILERCVVALPLLEYFHKEKTAKVRPGPRGQSGPCESFTHEPGRLSLWRSSGLLPVPQGQGAVILVKKAFHGFLFAQIRNPGFAKGAGQ